MFFYKPGVARLVSSGNRIILPGGLVAGESPSCVGLGLVSWPSAQFSGICRITSSPLLLSPLHLAFPGLLASSISNFGSDRTASEEARGERPACGVTCREVRFDVERELTPETRWRMTLRPMCCRLEKPVAGPGCT
jgi:hypothetical protein